MVRAEIIRRRLERFEQYLVILRKYRLYDLETFLQDPEHSIGASGLALVTRGLHRKMRRSSQYRLRVGKRASSIRSRYSRLPASSSCGVFAPSRRFLRLD